MSSIIIDGQEVSLVEQPYDGFREFARMCYGQIPRLMEMPREKRFIGQLPAGYLLSRIKAGDSLDEAMVQVALWNLHELGVRELGIDTEAGTANVLKSEATDAAEGKSEAINEASVNTGRAYIAALNNIAHRRFRLNDSEVEVGVQPEQQLKETMESVLAARKGEEGLLFVATRMIGGHLDRRTAINAPEMRCLIEVVAGMGVSAITADPSTQQIVFKEFSVMSAMSTALLQGVDWVKLQDIREQVRQLGKRLNPSLEMPSDTLLRASSPSKRRRRG
ncbi:MAG: hypothetical protein MK085_11235 [Phycisphaerales bacterium]|nr:hypothetical protein [Phycisphaerales bacterium]